MKHSFIQLPSIHLHVTEAGDEKRPLVILLHGFPEYWRCWQDQIDPLVAADFHVVMPDQRGYNLSEKPSSIQEYSLDHLAEDVVHLMDHFNHRKAFIVGHDWGGAVAWFVANKYPERVQKLVILDMPHHKVMRKFLASSWKQKLKSWYIPFFQLPFLPELYLQACNFYIMRRGLKKSLSKQAFSHFNINEYIESWKKPKAIHSIVNWYRAAFRYPPKRLQSDRIPMPTLVIWGKEDPFLGYEMAEACIGLCDQGKLHIFENAGHWVHRDKKEEVNKLIVNFLYES